MDKKYSSKLTKKQGAFCRKYLKTGNTSEAYRQSYNAENMTIKTVWEKAYLSQAVKSGFKLLNRQSEKIILIP